MFVSVNGLTLHYLCEGQDGREHLVLINSLGCDLHLWEDVAPYFSDRFRIIRYDKRGHGLSDSPPGPCSIEDHVADLVGLLDHLKVTSAIVVGISVGGMVAQALAAQHSDRVKLLVLCDTGTRIGTVEMWNQRIATLRQYGMDYLADAILERWFAPDFRARRPADYQGYHNMLVRSPVEGYTATCEAIRDADMTAAARAVRVPALVLGGSVDMATPPDLVRNLAQTMPNARLELIDQAAHLPCVEQPGVMAEAIRRFLGEHGYV
jgi:3-oxoadipate enol-lactonase